MLNNFLRILETLEIVHAKQHPYSGELIVTLQFIQSFTFYSLELLFQWAGKANYLKFVNKPTENITTPQSLTHHFLRR